MAKQDTRLLQMLPRAASSAHMRTQVTMYPTARNASDRRSISCTETRIQSFKSCTIQCKAGGDGVTSRLDSAAKLRMQPSPTSHELSVWQNRTYSSIRPAATQQAVPPLYCIF